MTINLRDHTRYPAKIKSLVLVEDKVTGKSYFAGVVDLPANISKGWEWANTSTRLNPFPFVETYDETTAGMGMAHFDSLAEFHIYKEKVAKKILNVMQYEETSVRSFDARKGEKYVLVQHNWYDAAREPICNYSAFYHVTGSGWMLETEGKLDLPFLDLVDTDGDFYPELLTGSNEETAIYEINYKGFSKKRSLSFSGDTGLVSEAPPVAQ